MKTKFLCLLLVCLLSGCSLIKDWLGDDDKPEPLPQLPDRGIIAQDILGLLHPSFPVPYVLEIMPDNFVGGHLDWTFGEEITNYKAIVNDPRTKAWRVHLRNGPCCNPWNNNCGSYEPHRSMCSNAYSSRWEQNNADDREHLRQRAKLYCDNTPARVKLYISPTLEHTLSNAAFDNQARIVKEACPRAEIVNNHVHDVYRSEYINESHNRHHNLPPGGLFSYDGNEAMDSNVPTEYARMKEDEKFFFIWSWTYNGRCTQLFNDPRNRFRWPNKAMLKDLFVWYQNLPAAPEPAAPINSPNIWKPWADDHCDGNPRSNKPVLLHTNKQSKAEILASDKSAIFTMPYDRQYAHDSRLAVYRSTKYGSEIADLAVARSGSPWVFLRLGGVVYGPFHPSMRQGTFK